MRLNSSMVHPVLFISSSSVITRSCSPHSLNIHLYKVRGRRWRKGKCETMWLCAICWWPPNGICQAGNPTNTAPSADKCFCRPERNRSLSLICSITSCRRIRGKFVALSSSWKMSVAMNCPCWCLWAKKARWLPLCRGYNSSCWSVTVHQSSFPGRYVVSACSLFLLEFDYPYK